MTIDVAILVVNLHFIEEIKYFGIILDSKVIFGELNVYAKN